MAERITPHSYKFSIKQVIPFVGFANYLERSENEPLNEVFPRMSVLGAYNILATGVTFYGFHIAFDRVFSGLTKLLN